MEKERTSPWLILFRVVFTAALIACIMFIFRNSLENGAQSSARSQAVMQLVNSALAKVHLGPLSEHLIRKLAHFSEFALEGFLLMLCIRVYTKHFVRHMSWPLLGGMTTALMDETIQLHSPNRTSSVVDVWIDMSGVVAGLLFALIILLIVLLSFALKDPLANLAQLPGFGWMQIVGSNLISIFIVFALLYWVGMARMVRSQILTLKENDYVMAAKALGAKDGRIIKKHLLTNCIGTLIVTTTLLIPSSIFTESYLSFLGMGVAVPLPSLGSLASDAINGMITFPYLLFAPCLLISLIILSFNLFGDGLRDAFDPKLKN